MPTFGFREPEINELYAFWPRVAEVGLVDRSKVGRLLEQVRNNVLDAMQSAVRTDVPSDQNRSLRTVRHQTAAGRHRRWAMSSGPAAEALRSGGGAGEELS